MHRVLREVYLASSFLHFMAFNTPLDSSDLLIPLGYYYGYEPLLWLTPQAPTPPPLFHY